MRDPASPPGSARAQELETLYTQVAQSAARLMVVHEASQILRSTHDPEELSRGLLAAIAEAVLAASGCVAGLQGDELKILATRGLEEHEADALAADPREARVWFAVADGEGPRTRADLAEALKLEPGSPVDASGGTDEGEEATESYEELWAEAEAEDTAAGSEAESHEGASTAPAFEFYLPLRIEEKVLGVLALGRRVDGQRYREEDIQLARSLSSHLSLALDHAALFAERNRRIEQLSVLLRISREITSSLDLDRVLGTIAQMVEMVLPNRRTTVALVSGGTVSLQASSDPSFRPKEAGRDPLVRILRWANEARLTINTHRGALEADSDADGRDLLLPWLSAPDGPRGLAIMPLTDDQGVLGLLAIETDGDAPPLDDDGEELVTILANQTTVAIRNAELYQRVPMIGVLEPILGRLRRARGLGRRRLLERAGIVVALLAAGFLIPLPAWVSGSALLRPTVPVTLRAGTDGIVDEVRVTEGQRVTAGALVARLRRDELELELQQTRAEVQRIRAEAARARSQNDFATYRAREAKFSELTEVERFYLAELERTSLIAPVDGIVLTRDVERRRGERLSRGEAFLDLADLSSMNAEVSISGHDIQSVSVGRATRLKVPAYPNRTFRGEVVSIAPRSDPDGTFRVTIRLPNEDQTLRPGMTGRAHVDIRARPPLVSFFRPVARRARLALWF
jgi:RND family efflux transporter MFP subunit